VQNVVKYDPSSLLIILVNECFHVHSAIDVCHGPIGKGGLSMQIVSMFHCQIHLF
jgi:hypothetical protein